MRYVVVAQSDIGISKDTNQDSVLVKHATYKSNEILMAIICDGMGGLSKGEVASATVIHRFDEWFSKELLSELNELDMNVIGGKWVLMLKELNIQIQDYGQKNNEKLGTTFTGILFINDKFVVVHIGDTRLYKITTDVAKQITEDHTFVAREVQRGNLTPEEAKIDKRKNMLLQCVGASTTIEPQIVLGNVEKGIYMLCSDGFRHKITNNEMCKFFDPNKLRSRRKIAKNCSKLISLNKKRQERDNISAIVIKSRFINNRQSKNKQGFTSYLKNKFIAISLGISLIIISILLFIIGMIFK